MTALELFSKAHKRALTDPIFERNYVRFGIFDSEFPDGSPKKYILFDNGKIIIKESVSVTDIEMEDVLHLYRMLCQSLLEAIDELD